MKKRSAPYPRLEALVISIIIISLSIYLAVTSVGMIIDHATNVIYPVVVYATLWYYALDDIVSKWFK